MHSLEIIIMLKRKSVDLLLKVDTDVIQSSIKVALKSLEQVAVPRIYQTGGIAETIKEKVCRRLPPQISLEQINI